MENWRNRDISRPLTSLVVLAVSIVTVTLVYYRGIYGLMASIAYFGGIAFLLAIYLTYTQKWPRLIRYLHQLWRQSY